MSRSRVIARLVAIRAPLPPLVCSRCDSFAALRSGQSASFHLPHHLIVCVASMVLHDARQQA
jgi:hypothetical protein